MAPHFDDSKTIQIRHQHIEKTMSDEVHRLLYHDLFRSPPRLQLNAVVFAR